MLGANRRLNIASDGVGGKDWSDMLLTSKGQNVVAVCDMDDERLSKATERYTAGGIDLVWHHGLKHPSLELLRALDRLTMSKNGILLVGEKGNLYVEYEKGPFLWPEEKFADYKFEMEPDDDHYMQWAHACLGEGNASCPFSYSGPLH